MKIIIFFLLSNLFVSLNAFSQEPSFCVDPIKTICKDTKVRKAKDDEVLNKLKAEILKEANKNIGPALSNLDKLYTDDWHTKNRDILRYMILNKEIMKSANSRIRGLETSVINDKNISMVKNFFKIAIDESKFDLTTRLAFKKTVDSVNIISFSKIDFINGVKYDFKKFKDNCGADGMIQNAFSQKVDKHKIVIICPGKLINLSQISNVQERVNSILFTLSHEIAHHVEKSDAAAKVFNPYINCLAKHYGNDFFPNDEDSIYCKNVGRKSDECKRKVTQSHSIELIPDQWAIKVLAIFAERNRLSVVRTTSFLQSNLLNFCGTADGGRHPTGNFRIANLLRMDPGISDYLSCNNSKILIPSCTFDGAVNL